MVLDPIPQSLPVHFFGSRPQPPPTSRLCIPSTQEFRSDLTFENLYLQYARVDIDLLTSSFSVYTFNERWGAGVETQKNVRGEIGGWGRVPFNEPYAPSLSTIYDGA